jgi:hypothetical protein
MVIVITKSKYLTSLGYIYIYICIYFILLMFNLTGEHYSYDLLMIVTVMISFAIEPNFF